MEVLPHSITLLIFSYLPYKFVRTTASLVCKAWRQLAYDKSLINYATEKEFSEINVEDASAETVNYFLQAVKWRPSLFHRIDLSGAKTTWETFHKIAHNCSELIILNMARIEGKVSHPDYPLIQAVKLVELNLSETMIDDCLFVFITKRLPRLGILNVSKCHNLTDLAVEKASLPSLRFLALGECKVRVDALLCAIDKHGIFSMCVKGVKLSSEEIACLLNLHPNIADIGIPTLCGLGEEIVSQTALPQLCFYCCTARSSTILSAKEGNDGSWMEL